MKTRIKVILMSVAAMLCFAVSVSAQKVSVAIVDQHYAAETTHYKLLMGLLTAAYVIYLVMHNKRRKAIKRFYGRF